MNVPSSTILTVPNWGKDTHPQAVIAWALARYHAPVMTSGFNLNGVVLIDMAVGAGYRGDVLFVDTGYHFRETLDTRDRLVARYPALNFVTISAKRPDDGLFRSNVDLCCALRKILPLQQHLAELQPDAIFSARSREQTQARQELAFLEGGESRVRVNPLIYWSRLRLERYARERGLPVNPLYWDGFLSIGCAPCTRAVRPGEDARSGRWPGQDKNECGLWHDDAV